MARSKQLFSGLLVLVLGTVVLLACVREVTPAPSAPSAPTRAATAPAIAPKATAGLPATPKPVITTAPQPKAPGQRPYYEGKTIEIVVSADVAGGTDTVARIIAPFLSKHVPGNPKVVIRNQPGAQGVSANNIFYAKAKPDGLSLMQGDSGPISLQLKKRDIVKYDLSKYRYVGTISRSTSVLMIRKGLMGRLADANAPPLVVATREGEETWQSMPIFGKEFLGWNLRWVPGFPGTNEMELALRRGEIDIMGTANAYIVNRLMQDGVTENVATIGMLKGAEFVRRPDFPDVRTFVELLGDKKPSGVPWQAYLVFIAPNLADKFLAAAPGTPDNVVALLTEAYGKMVKEPQFDTMVKRMVSDVYSVAVGQEVETIMKQILTASPEVLDYIVGLQRKFGIMAR